MTIHYPASLEHQGAYEPLVRLLRDTLLRPRELADRWRFSQDHLSNLRRRNIGPPAIRLPTASGAAKRPMGSLRYRLSDVILAEITGTHGSLTLERVALVISGCDFLSEPERGAVLARIREALA